MQHVAKRKDRRNGFSLIELLTVVAIVAIIAAIVLPIFSSARERARRTVCLSNSRQIAMAFQQYVNDNNGAYPLDFGAQWQMAVYPYVKNPHVFHCPDRPADANGPHDSNRAMTDMQFIDYTFDLMRLNTFAPPYPTKTVYGTQEAKLATPSTIWLTRDSGWITADGVYHYGRMVKTSCGRSFIGSTLHSGGGDYSFLDGHAEWLTPEAMGEIDCANGPLPAPFKD